MATEIVVGANGGAMIEGRIADAEAHVDDLEALPPA